MGSVMSNDEYLATQEALIELAEKVVWLDLQGFLQRLEIAEAAGPVLAPELWRAASATTSAFRRLADAALAFRKAAREFLADGGPRGAPHDACVP